MFPLQLRLNFVLVYELLDEILDFGVPQGTSTELLKAFIFCEPQEVDSSNALEQGLSALAKFSLGESKIKSAAAAHKSVASRSSKNELFVDVLEVHTRCSFCASIHSAEAQIINFCRIFVWYLIARETFSVAVSTVRL
jgi:hypothetical protein